MIYYEVTGCRTSDFNVGPDSHLLWPRLVIFGIILTFLRATQSRDIFSNVYGYRDYLCKSKMAGFKLSLIKLRRITLDNAT